jgi:hypothetical protein
MVCVVVRVPRLSTIPNSHHYEQWSGKAAGTAGRLGEGLVAGQKGQLTAIAGEALTTPRFAFT